MARGVYSKGPKANVKRDLDEDILADNSSAWLDMGDPTYLRALIERASAGKKRVSDSARGLQFFIIRGGGEGFLEPGWENWDASRYVQMRPVESAHPQDKGSMVMDYTDLLVVFDPHGNLVSSALLERPLSINFPDCHWREAKANSVYEAWDQCPVGIYWNGGYDITYYGLYVDDKLGYRATGICVDMHKRECTSGCIFIADDKTPECPKDDTDLSALRHLNSFEPQLIRDVQRSIGAKEKKRIGIMHMVDMKSPQAASQANGDAPPIESLKGVQYRLNSLGLYDGLIHGTNDPKTKDAVREFQKRYMPNDPKQWDGIPGPVTQRKLLQVVGW